MDSRRRELGRTDALRLFERRDAVARRTFRHAGNSRDLITSGEMRLGYDVMARIDRHRKAHPADRKDGAQQRLLAFSTASDKRHAGRPVPMSRSPFGPLGVLLTGRPRAGEFKFRYETLTSGGEDRLSGGRRLRAMLWWRE